jgi:hypothetical protein
MSETFELAGFTLEVHGRQFPDAEDYWDANWLFVTCICRAPGSSVKANGSFVCIDEIADLLRILEELHSGVQTECVLKCMEPELSLSFETVSLGKLRFIVELTPDNIQQFHKVSFDIDQSYLLPAINQCKSILQKHPIKDDAT